jgi:hypothetical protein
MATHPAERATSPRAAERLHTTRAAFLAACARRGVPPATSEAVWDDLAVSEPSAAGRGLTRGAAASIVAGALLLCAAGAWWASLVHSAAGAPGLAAFAAVVVALLVLGAETARRRALAPVDAALAVAASAYAVLAAFAVEELVVRGQPAAHWPGRLVLEVVLLAAGVAAAWRYGQPALTLLPVAVASGALCGDALISAVDGWDRDISEWPAWTAAAAVALAVAATAVALALDRARLRAAAFWPSLLADATTLAAATGIAAARGAGPVGSGAALAFAGALVLARGAAVDRLVQVGIGAVAFWLGAIMAATRLGGVAVAAVTSVAGITLIGGAVLAARRRRRRADVGRSAADADGRA